MYNFFSTTPKINQRYLIEGNDFNHLVNVLRMRVGDRLLVSFDEVSDLCEIESVSTSSATLTVIEENYQNTELPVSITLFQALPKGDKTELIIQKAVELGAKEIIPVETSRCIVKIENKKKDSKISRWQAIAESAAKQSKRNVIPQVGDLLTFKQAVQKIKDYDLFLLPYENHEGMKSTVDALSQVKKGGKIAVFIGPEGGFSEQEVLDATTLGAKVISLGKRILRAETASITALSMIMLYVEAKLQ